MANKAFERFKNKCVLHLSALQDEFMKLYHINSYEHWYYDHGIGIFHFKSEDGRNLYFKYVDVGSYSTVRNNWLWSWDNSSTPNRAKRGLEKVKAYGEQNDFSELSQGLLESGDEYTGWEMTAIAGELLPAIGAYRIQQEHLFIYFIFTNELIQEEYDELKKNCVECDKHGTGRISFVCQHLPGGSDLGFNEAFESDPLMEQDDDYHAWCDDCSKAVKKGGEWNETFIAFSNPKIVCDECYFEIKAKNKIQ